MLGTERLSTIPATRPLPFSAHPFLMSPIGLPALTLRALSLRHPVPGADLKRRRRVLDLGLDPGDGHTNPCQDHVALVLRGDCPSFLFPMKLLARVTRPWHHGACWQTLMLAMNCGMMIRYQKITASRLGVATGTLGMCLTKMTPQANLIQVWIYILRYRECRSFSTCLLLPTQNELLSCRSLMLRDGLLSPHSKILPQNIRSDTPVVATDGNRHRKRCVSSVDVTVSHIHYSYNQIRCFQGRARHDPSKSAPPRRTPAPRWYRFDNWTWME